MTDAAPDLAWLRNLAGELGGLTTRREVVDTSIAVLSQRFGSEVTTYNQLVLGPTAHTPLPAVDHLVGSLRGRLAEHPLFTPVVHGSKDGPAAPVLLSDVLSVRQWRAHPIYTELFRPHGIPLHTACVPVTGNADGRLEWYQVNREQDFTAREVDLLTRLQPVLIGLTRRTSSRPAPTGVTLSPRETELLQHLARGLTVSAAARQLGIATSTARKHLEHVHRKLDTHGPVATVRRAIDLRLIDPAEL